MADKLRIIDLPTEILWRIAVLGPVENVVSLTQVCHVLRDALFDTVLYKSFLKDPKVGSGPPLELDAICSIIGNDAAAWGRLAVADQELRALRVGVVKDDLGDNLIGFLQSLDRYAPSLVAIKHPSIFCPEIVNLLTEPLRITSAKIYRCTPTLNSFHQSAKDVISSSLGLCLCSAALSSLRTFPGYADGLFASRIVRSYVRDLEHLDFEGGETYDEFFTTRITLVSLCAWASLLDAHIEMLHDADEDGPRIPNTKNIPWLSNTSAGRLPLPFLGSRSEMGRSEAQDSVATYDEWYEDRVAAMSDPEWLTEGEWCGYWSFDNYVTGTPSVSFAQGIERMKLVIPPIRRSTRHGCTMSVPIMATYPDANHNLVLEGSCSPGGLFDLGPPGESWCWRGRITLFGMFGYWGSQDCSKIAGACWLWKRSWSEGVREEAPKPPEHLAAL